MKKKRKILWQTREVPFPKKAWVVAIWLKGPQDYQLYPLTLNRLILTLSDLNDYIPEYKKEVLLHNSDIAFLDTVLLQRVYFDRLVPLKKKYWQVSATKTEPVEEMNLLQKMSIFAKLFLYYSLYHLLVTPSGRIEGVEYFAATFPILATAKKKDIERFMLNSNFAVDTSAKHAALYTAQEPIGYNWITNKFVKKHHSVEVPRSDNN